MSSIPKIIFRILLAVIFLVIVTLSGIIIHAQINEFDPDEKTILKQPKAETAGYDRKHFDFVSWNIGYGGLGKEMDFFYDEGEKVRPEPAEFEGYIRGIYQKISSFRPVDFYLLQEVDINSRRSYFSNEKFSIEKLLEEYESFFAVNYHVKFVPLPFTKPMGRVQSGIQLLCKAPPHSVEKIYYPSSYSWPYRLFMLDRAYIKAVYHLKNNNNLVVYNTHNSAFDDGALRETEFLTIKRDMLSEYEQGNYVVAGGDWNQNPPAFDPANDPLSYNYTEVRPRLENTAFPRHWQWCWDPAVPTNRSNSQPFVKGENTTTIIDFFIVSPNLKVDTVITHDMQFRYSDHQPVYMRISIPPEKPDSL